MKAPVLGDALPRRGNRLSRRFCRAVMSLFGWRVEADIPNLPKMVLIAAPHTSNWDFVIAMLALAALGLKISWMGKNTLFWWPFSLFLIWLGGVPIDRNIQGGIVDQTVEAFRRFDRFFIGLTPEGTRGKVKRWRMGFYHIAMGAKVPIGLVRFDYGRKVMGFGPTIEPTGDVTADMERIQSIFASVQGKNPSNA